MHQKYIFPLYFFVLIFSTALSASDDSARFSNLTKAIRCVTCGGQSIQDSPSDFAQEIKKGLIQAIGQGKSDDQIFQNLREKYGDDVLFTPPINQHTILLWTMPVTIFLLSLFLGFYRYYVSRNAGTSP